MYKPELAPWSTGRWSRCAVEGSPRAIVTDTITEYGNNASSSGLLTKALLPALKADWWDCFTGKIILQDLLIWWEVNGVGVMVQTVYRLTHHA